MKPATLLLALALVALPVAVQAETVQHSADNGAAHLVYLDQGQGPAVVMIPSLGRGAADFDDLAGRLSLAGFRVLRVQPRGIGGSTGPMTGLHMRDLAEDVNTVIHAAGLERAIVLGHDDGNRVARATAAYFPASVSGVILVGSGGRIPPDREAAVALRDTFDTSMPAGAHLKAVATAFFAPGHDPSVWKDGWYPKTAAMERAAGSLTNTSEWWTAGQAPLLVVQGLQDRIAPAANADILKADVGARAEVVFVDGAGHALLPEQPEKLASTIIGWLKLHP